MKIRLRFVPRDLWVGVYFAPTQFFSVAHKQKPAVERRHRLFICLLPMLPIEISWSSFREIPQDRFKARVFMLAWEQHQKPMSGQELLHNLRDILRNETAQI